jgi:hypothetical protein
MDVVKTFDSSALFCISKSSNNHILFFTWNGSSIDVKWILRNEGELAVQKGVDVFSQALLGISLVPTGDQLKINFSVPVPVPHDLFLVDVDGQLKVMFDKTKLLLEIYVDMETSEAYCKCYSFESKNEFVMKMPVELGLLGNLF